MHRGYPPLRIKHPGGNPFIFPVLLYFKEVKLDKTFWTYSKNTPTRTDGLGEREGEKIRARKSSIMGLM